MRRCVVAVLAVTVLCCSAGASSLSMGLTGIIQGPGPAQVGDWMQVGPHGPNDVTAAFPFGQFTSYSATAPFPQVGSDLSKYGWAMTGTIDSIDPVNRVITYSGNWWLNYMGNGGYQLQDNCLETGTFVMQASFPEGWQAGAVADVTGTLTVEQGPRHGTLYWPGNPDWYVAGAVGELKGTFDSATNRLTAEVNMVPEPLTMLAFGMGLAGVGSYIRRRKAA